MKKLSLSLCLLGLIISQVKADYSGTYENISWTVTTADSTLTISGTGRMPNIQDFGTASWYAYHNQIAHVIVENGITSIGDWCCGNYLHLRSVVLPEGITYIGNEAFRNCHELSICNFPSTLDSIGTGAFEYTAITSAELPTQMHYLGSAVFEGCTGITEITIPLNIQNIEDRTFSNLGIFSIDIPDNVTNIDARAFSNNERLTLVDIGIGVKSMGASAFLGCPHILFTHYAGTINDWLKISFGGDYAHPGGYVYFDHQLLTMVNIPASRTTIPQYAFSRFIITGVNCHNNVTSIGAAAFSHCDSLTNVTLSNSLRTLGANAFYACSNLSSITIPGSLSKISNSTFSHCSGLTNVTIEEGVTSVEQMAFEFCSNLQYIQFPHSMTNIGEYAFYRCTALTSIQMGTGIASIGKKAFNTFDESCSLQLVSIDALTPPSLGQDAFSKNYNTGLLGKGYPLSVPCSSSSAYAQSAWGNVFSTIEEHYVEGNLEVYSYDEEQGSVKIVSQPSDCSSRIAVISATPLDGYQFDKWDDNNTDNPRRVVVTGDYQYYIALFKPIVKVRIDVFADPIEGQVEGAGEYIVGETITITAIPNEGYVFSHWDDGNTDNPRQVTVSDTRSYVAFFTPQADALENVLMQPYRNGKYIIDGELYIIKDGKFFSPLGTEIKTTQH